MQSENKFLIPLAVLVAGALIGGAVFFKGKGPASNGDGINEPVSVTVEPIKATDHVLGNPNAKIVIIEYSDIDCPFCARFDATMRLIMDAYGADGSVAWVYRHFPLPQLHPEAQKKAEATECVAALAGNDAFWNYLGALFERTETAADLATIATEFGVDSTAFETCLSSNQQADKVADDIRSGKVSGVQGTPFSVAILPDGSTIPINGAQGYDVVEQIIKTGLLITPTEPATE